MAFFKLNSKSIVLSIYIILIIENKNGYKIWIYRITGEKIILRKK